MTLEEICDVLTIKQRKFCDEYIQTTNAKQSYLNHYGTTNPKTAATEGAKNLAKPDLKLYIKLKMESLQSPTVASAQEVLEFLTATLRGECEDTKRDRVRAAELLSKRYGLLTEVIKINAVVEMKESEIDDRIKQLESITKKRIS